MVWPGWAGAGMVTPGTERGMNALIQNSTTRGAVGEVTGGEPLATQHCTSLGPGQRPETNTPLEQPVAWFKQIPGEPAVLVQEVLMQHFTLAGSLGQRPETEKPVGDQLAND
jgi:hypothetical protein